MGYYMVGEDGPELFIPKNPGRISKPQPRLPDPSRPCECGCHPSTGHLCRTHRVTAWIARLVRRAVGQA